VKGSCSAAHIVYGAALFLFASQQLAIAQQIDRRAPEGSPDSQQDVLLSHTIGKDGIPFPKPQESKWKPVRTSSEGPGAVPTEVPAPTATPYQQPKSCTKNETKRVVYKEKDTETKLYVDYLFIPEELVPMDPEEVFGSKVSLIPYGPEAGEAAKIRMENNEVPCLPYRHRLTNTAEYFYTGIHALKNYDGAPRGAGKLHPLMQQKLYPNNRGAGSNRPSTRR
jgi:hypothetical protein